MSVVVGSIKAVVQCTYTPVGGMSIRRQKINCAVIHRMRTHTLETSIVQLTSLGAISIEKSPPGGEVKSVMQIKLEKFPTRNAGSQLQYLTFEYSNIHIRIYSIFEYETE